MPIYEYQCAKCGQFEVMQRITEAPLKRCPTCQSKVTKLISNTSFQLKGTGWYVTDYGRKDGSSGRTQPAKQASESKTESASTSNSTDKPGSSTDKPGGSKEPAAA